MARPEHMRGVRRFFRFDSNRNRTAGEVSAERAQRTRSFTGLGQDVRYALRSLLKRPSFTVAVVATIALGVGANAAIFAVVDAALVRPLPFARPDRLVHLWERNSTAPAGKHSEASYPDLLDIRSRSNTLSGVAGYQRARLTLSAGDRAMVLSAAKVTSNFFDVLGVTPVAGRRFARGEDEPGAPPVALLAYSLWQRAFAGNREIIGRVIQLDGASYTVAGVLPNSFQFATSSGAEVWVPIDRSASYRANRGNHWINAIGRMKEGVTLDAARRDLGRVMRELAHEQPATNAEQTGEIVPLRDELVGSVRPVILTLYGAVAFVLLVACGNVANLLLMRGTSRQREMSIRAALGAGRGRIARQLLTESGILALAGGALGLLVAQIAIRGLVAAIPPEQARVLPYLRQVGISGVVVGYTVLVSLVAGAISGLMPALRASRTELQSMLRQSGGTAAAGSQRMLRDSLVVAELAMTVVLVSGAAMFARSLTSLLAVDTGFRGDGVLTMMVPLPRGTYRNEVDQRRLYRALEERVAALPGVRGVGFTSKLPLDYGNSGVYVAAGAPPAAPGHETTASYRVVNPQYFATLGIPFIRGQSFSSARESTTAYDITREIIINRAMAREAFGDRDPIGRQIYLDAKTQATVIGVVGDVTIGKLEDRIPPTMYFSYLESMDASLRLAVRTDHDPRSLVAPIRAILSDLDPTVGVFQVYTMDELLGQSQSVFLRRYPLLLVGSFAIVALVLALLGTYGVISYSVAQRLRELGIRIALGAKPATIRWMVLRHAGSLALIGIGAGIVLAVGLSRLASSLMYGVSGAEPMIFGGVGALLATMALAAALVPAHRATRADPLIALKAD